MLEVPYRFPLVPVLSDLPSLPRSKTVAMIWVQHITMQALYLWATLPMLLPMTLGAFTTLQTATLLDQRYFQLLDHQIQCSLVLHWVDALLIFLTQVFYLALIPSL